VPAAPVRQAGFQPLEQKPSLTSEVAARIAAEIEAGRMEPGSQLPPEHLLMESFGVSRTTIREAVAALRAEGLIVTRQGRGTFVAATAPRRSFKIDPAALKTIADVVHVLELRVSLEVESAGLAAARRRKAHLDRIASVLGEMDAAIDRGESAVDLDFAFHRAIADATQNPYFRRFLDFLGHIVIPRGSIAEALEAGGVDRRLYLRRIQAEHRAIEAAIVAKDSSAARQAARLHLVRGRERYRMLRSFAPGSANEAAD